MPLWEVFHKGKTHLKLVRGYLGDPRFKDYYDTAAGNGGAEFLVRTMEANL